MLGASARWLLAYLGAAIVGAFVPLGLSAEALALVAALTPIVFFRGRFAPARTGLGVGAAARCSPPTTEEGRRSTRRWRCCAGPTRPQAPGGLYVLDAPLPAAGVRGRTLILTRRMVESPSLPPSWPMSWATPTPSTAVFPRPWSG